MDAVVPYDIEQRKQSSCSQLEYITVELNDDDVMKITQGKKH